MLVFSMTLSFPFRWPFFGGVDLFALLHSAAIYNSPLIHVSIGLSNHIPCSSSEPSGYGPLFAKTELGILMRSRGHTLSDEEITH